jgi:hypothetical protein
MAWNGSLIYKYSASDPAYWRLRPNNLLLWRAIQWACENGYHTFDMGRTDLAGGSGRDLLGSIVTKLLVLDDDTVVLPGHGEPTTIGVERRTNPFLEGLTP